MEKYKFKSKPVDDDEEVKRQTKGGHGPCEVFGCNRAGHIHTTNWNCRYHHGKKGEILGSITMLLKNHEREIDWYEKVLNMPGFDWDILKGNAPKAMMVFPNETLTSYKVRLAEYVNHLLTGKVKADKPEIRYTFADFAGVDDA